MNYFEREDWTLFRNLATLGQRAGVPLDRVPLVVVKELVDNALDAAGDCVFDMDDGAFRVEDHGPGLPGADADIGNLFSVSRPLTSSKLLRLPTRGALGNGLRVVSGAVLASGGTLVVSTRGRSLRLRPRDADGGTDVEPLGPWSGGGTRVEVKLGAGLTFPHDAYRWAGVARRLAAAGGRSYKGKSSPWWYDSDSFFELLQAAGERTVRDLVEDLDGCTGRKAGMVTRALLGRTCGSMTRDEADDLLEHARLYSGQVKPARLGYVGPAAYPDNVYSRAAGIFEAHAARGRWSATVPFTPEAWGRESKAPSLAVLVNRTPITADVWTGRNMQDKTLYGLVGCGLSSEKDNTATAFKVGRKRDFAFVVNITTPYMPVTTDGKEPNLTSVVAELRDTLEKVARRLRRNKAGTTERTSKKAVTLAALPAATAKASGSGRYRYSQRQLFYAVRPALLEAFGKEPDFNYFCQVLTGYEAELGHDLEGMYRDDRGTLYHPDLREDIPLGTRSVEKYTRPPWTFNKILYCEKEGFFPILKDACWPERHDCALLTSKGYAGRAARDLLDLLGDTDEDITFLAIHDADGPGTMIYQSLTEATKARPARRVRVVNLGLEPEEALELGLAVEPVKRKDERAVAVAEYVPPEWKDWLQTHRVELNAMTTPAFLAWLDGKLEAYTGKLVPPAHVLEERLAAEVKVHVREALLQEAIREARVDERTEETMTALRPQLQNQAAGLVAVVEAGLQKTPENHWTRPIRDLATAMAGGV